MFRSLLALGRRRSANDSHKRIGNLSTVSSSIAVTCRGAPITRDELFEYTNGRFLINEEQARKRRYTTFNLENLCAIAESIGERSPVKQVEKMEGGFSKALLLKKEDGSELIAKIPFSIAGTPGYTTASEVAVLKYVSCHTSVPVPQVFAWDTDPSGPVGAEYIIMEKAPGVQLFNKWRNMTELQQFNLIKNLARLEGQLTELSFPAHGSLYLRESLKGTDKRIDLEYSADPSGLFCMGPSYDRGWFDQNDTANIQSFFDSGPWPTLSTFGHALVDRERARIEEHIVSETHTHMTSEDPRTSELEKLSLLDNARKVMSSVGPKTLIAKVSRPVLWHTDLHMGNIYVSESDPTQILSLIDWQSAAVAPLYLQARFPEFISPGPNSIYEFDAEFPTQRGDYDTLDTEEKEIYDTKLVEAKMAKGYEMATGAYNNDGYKALSIPFYLQELFLRSAEASSESIVPLRACLIQLLHDWPELDFIGEPPFAFDEKSIHQHQQELYEYETFQKIQEIAKDALSTDSEGWIAPQLDFGTKQKENKELLRYLMENSSEYGKTPSEMRDIWPFSTAA